MLRRILSFSTVALALPAGLGVAALADPSFTLAPPWSHVDQATAGDTTRKFDQWHISGESDSVTMISDSTTAYADAVALIEKNFTDNKIKPAIDKDFTCNAKPSHVVEFAAGPEGHKIIINRILIPNGTGVITITYARSDQDVDPEYKKSITAYCGGPVALYSFVTLLAMVNPIEAAGAFASLTGDKTPQQRNTIAMRATLLAAGILVGFALVGDALLRALGISIEAFQIAGGLLLLRVAFNMVFAKETDNDTADDAKSRPQSSSDPSVFPLAIPIITGPGAPIRGSPTRRSSSSSRPFSGSRTSQCESRERFRRSSAGPVSTQRAASSASSSRRSPCNS
jgi:hypothetical protein